MADQFGVKRQLDTNPRDEKERGSNPQISPDYTGKPNPSGTLSSAPYGSQSSGSQGSQFSSSGGNRSSADAGTQHDRISRRAYELWEQRGRQHGHELEDWLRAEREVKRT